MATTSHDRIDVHHHYLPPAYFDSVNTTYPPGSFNNPPWNLSLTKEFMSTHNIRTTIFSVTDPPPNTVPANQSIRIARQSNEYGAQLRDSDPSRFGFFAMIPDPLAHPQAALDEITHSLDVLRADGIGLLTRYGAGPAYLGHEEYKPLWDLLEAKKAVVFIHPARPADAAHNQVNPVLVPPVIDYPHETTRTALDLITSNTLSAHPSVKIILSHAGGTLPYLALRAAALLPPILARSGSEFVRKSTEEILEELSGFYFDVALGSGELVLGVLTRFARKGHVLFGSDFPYGTVGGIGVFLGELGEWEMGGEEGWGIDRGGAEGLFPRLRGGGGGGEEAGSGG
ncbi:MAG: hypothetical protein Q9219_004694 [cf. Caloplaca sp. 3 TL-2023]